MSTGESLSLLTFHHYYLQALVVLGERDAERQMSRIDVFLAGVVGTGNS